MKPLTRFRLLLFFVTLPTTFANVFHSDNMKPSSLFTGRIISSIPEKTDNGVESRTECQTSDKKLGFCSKLSDCLHFDFSQLHNNVCFMDVFIPGVCCSHEKPQDRTTTPVPTTVTKIAAYTPPTTYDKPNRTEQELGCGITSVPSSRIIRGHQSQPGEWPWMAAIFTNSILGRKFHCGGSLITKRHVLTGAHCMKDRRGVTFSPRQITVRLGDNDVSSLNDIDNLSAQFYNVEEIVVHPRFKNINQYFLNDVAVLKLTRDVHFSSHVNVICLPESEDVNEPLDSFAGRYSTVIGYGRTEKGIPSMKLLNALVPVWRNRDCDNAYFAPITDKFICAGYPAGGVDACQGDSGGPLLLKNNGKWTQVGITSFGRGCGEPGYPGVYTRLSQFSDWIRKNSYHE